MRVLQPDQDSMGDPESLARPAKRTGRPPRPVQRLTDGETFSSLKEAAVAMGVNPSTLHSAIANGHRTHGHLWRYADGCSSPSRYRYRAGISPRARAVVRGDGVQYPSIKEAAQANETRTSAILRAIRLQHRHHGHEWFYRDEN